MKKQIVIIHGGSTYDSYEKYLHSLRSAKLDFGRLKQPRWRDNLKRALGKNFEVILLKMPCPENAKYLEWKIWFKKVVPFLASKVVLVGHSLGGIFLAKYLSENKFPKKNIAVFLIAAPFDKKDSYYSLADFILPKNLRRFEKQSDQIFLYHGQDDPVVPLVNLEKYRKLLPQATVRVFQNKGHFNQSSFPELAKEIKNIF